MVCVWEECTRDDDCRYFRCELDALQSKGAMQVKVAFAYRLINLLC